MARPHGLAPVYRAGAGGGRALRAAGPTPCVPLRCSSRCVNRCGVPSCTCATRAAPALHLPSDVQHRKPDAVGSAAIGWSLAQNQKCGTEAPPLCPVPHLRGPAGHTPGAVRTGRCGRGVPCRKHRMAAARTWRSLRYMYGLCRCSAPQCTLQGCCNMARQSLAATPGRAVSRLRPPAVSQCSRAAATPPGWAVLEAYR